MKKCLIISNHYYWGWYKLLNSSRKFYDSYFLEYIPTYEEPKKIHEKLIKNADLIIYQDVNSPFPEHSLEHIQSINSKVNGALIKIANWNFEGFWPYKSKNESKITQFPFPADEFGPNLNFNQYMNHEFDLAKIHENFELAIERLYLIDQNSDIKIFDHFINNYKNHRLFRDAWHPSPYFFKLLTNELFKIIGIEDSLPALPEGDFKANYRLITKFIKQELHFEEFEDDHLYYFDELITTQKYYDFSNYLLSKMEGLNISSQEDLKSEFYGFLGRS